MLAEVVTKVAAFLEGGCAPRIFALEEQLHSLSMRVLNFDRLVPFLWDPFEMLRSEILVRLDPVFVVDHIFVII